MRDPSMERPEWMSKRNWWLWNAFGIFLVVVVPTVVMVGLVVWSVVTR